MNETLNQSINVTAQAVQDTLIGSIVPFTGSLTADIFLISLVGSLFVTLVNKYLSDQVKIKALRLEMKELRKQQREFMTKDPKKAQKVQQEMMKKSMENMKHSMNPKIMLTTMLPMLFLFALVRQYYSQFGEFFNFLGFTHFGWLGTYIVFSIINSIVLKKLLDVA